MLFVSVVWSIDKKLQELEVGRNTLIVVVSWHLELAKY